MKKIVLTACAAAMLTVAGAGVAEAGCYRMGLSGYHWYRYCIGPGFLYPHARHCGWHNGYRTCWYN